MRPTLHLSINKSILSDCNHCNVDVSQTPVFLDFGKIDTGDNVKIQSYLDQVNPFGRNKIISR